jgi:hypothetical protein
VPILIIEVEAIADDEGIRDGETAVVGLDWHNLATDLSKQDGCPDGRGPPVLEMLGESTQGLARVEDIVEKENVAPGDIRGKRFVEHQGCRRRRLAPVATGLYQCDPQGNSDLANQISESDQTSGEDRHDRERFVSVGFLDLATYHSQTVPNLRFVDQQFYGHGGFVTSIWILSILAEYASL